jgi:hypothetical protein
MKYLRLSLKAATAVLAMLLAAQVARADETIDALRAELGALKAQYESRIEALEQRLDAAEQQLAREQQQPAEPVESYAAVPPPAAATNSYASSGNEFNPAMGVILNGAYRAYEKNPEDYYIPGFPAGGESGPADRGFSLGESEFVFTANVDDWFFGRVTMAVEQEDNEFSTSLEEAYLDTLSLPANSTLRFGRFYSSVGYLNDKHPHSWDFADQALPYSAFMGSQYGDDGIQLRWLAPTDLYVELGAELFRGSSYPAAGDAHNGRGTQSVFAKLGGDVGISNSWIAGLSWFNADARDRDSGDEDDPAAFAGTTEIAIADFVWKWAPNGNNRERNLIFQTEYLWRNENGDYLLSGLDGPAPIDADTSGWYAQLIYQWQRGWRAGVRVDGLSLDDPGPQFAGSQLEALGDDPMRYTLMFDYSHSEFSRIRLQFERDESGLENNNQLTLQYIMSIGAHGAHEF